MSANPDRLKHLKDLNQKAIFFSVARVPNTQRLFVGGSDFKVAEIDLAADKPEVKELGAHGSYVTSVALSGKTLVFGGYDCRLIWWDIESRTQIRAVDAHAKCIRTLAPSPDGTLVASVADDMVCRIWEVASGKLVHELRGHNEKTPHEFPSMLYAVAWTPDGKHVATGDKVGHIVVWEAASGKAVTTVEAPGMYTWDVVQRKHSIGGIRSLAFSPDGTQLAVGGMGKVGNIDHLEGKARLEVFDWRKGERFWEVESDKFKGLINHLEFEPTNQWLLGAGGAGEGYLLFWDVKNKKVLRQEKAATHIHDVATSETRETIWAVGHNKIMIFEMKG